MVIPLVAASEKGKKQTESLSERKERCGVGEGISKLGKLKFSGKRRHRK